MAVLGLLHVIYTLRDFGAEPKYFRPTRVDLLDQMRASKTALAPKGRDYWSGVLGFHLSHSLGLLLFATLAATAAFDHDAHLAFIIPLIPFGYALIAYRCWFQIPLIGSIVAGLLISIGLAFR